MANLAKLIEEVSPATNSLYGRRSSEFWILCKAVDPWLWSKGRTSAATTKLWALI